MRGRKAASVLWFRSRVAEIRQKVSGNIFRLGLDARQKCLRDAGGFVDLDGRQIADSAVAPHLAKRRQIETQTC